MDKEKALADVGYKKNNVDAILEKVGYNKSGVDKELKKTFENIDNETDEEYRKAREKDRKEKRCWELEIALSESKKPIQRLGQGVLKDVFYYGTQLIFQGSPVSAVITSDGDCYLGIWKVNWECKSCGDLTQSTATDMKKIRRPKSCSCEKKRDMNWQIIRVYNDIRDLFGLNYRTEFNEDALDCIWQTESIRKYLDKEKLKIGRNHAIKELKKIYDDILQINEKYIDHLNTSSHKYISCWIIASYCFILFEQFGRLYNKAERGSGKTKQARILKNLCFNPMWITKGTESSQFRDAEATCGTFIVDNMDKLHEDLKRSIEHYIETAWMREATYRLTDKETGRTMKFQAYTPMALNNIYGLDENTIDKTFEIPMLKSVNNKINRLKVTSKSEKWEDLRERMRFWMLDNWKIVKETYETLHADFSGRAFDVAEGVLTIAKLLNEELFKELEKYCIEKLEEEIIDLENNHMFMVFSEIWQEFYNNPMLQQQNIFLGDVADRLFDKFNPHLIRGTNDYNNKKKGFSKYIGKIIRSVPMFRKGGMSQGRTYIKVNRKELEQYMKLQHFINEDGTLLTSTTSTNSTKLLTSTNLSKKEEKSLKKVDEGSLVDVVEQKSRVEQKFFLDSGQHTHPENDGINNKFQEINPVCPICKGKTELKKSTSGEGYYCLNYAYCGGLIKKYDK